jgi:peptidoglycan DL-endopeptidase CwlO
VRRSFDRTTLSLVMSLVLFLTGGMVIMPVSAFGLVDTAMSDEAASVDTITTLQAEVERSGQAYDDASERLQNIQNDLSRTNTRIAELEKLLPQQEEQSNEAIVILYKYRTDNSTFIDMLFSASSFSEVMKVLQYFGYLNESNLATIAQTKAMKEELETSRSKLEADRVLAEQAKQSAADALASAQAARIEAQRRADEKIAAELAAAQASVSAGASTTVSASTPADTSESVNWATDKSTFVNEWAARINDYLSGSPLSGYGRTFAEAAYDYGVDPSWSPAIATIESSRGAAGSLARNYYNAWGWGTKHFSSWDESIPQHVAYLARKYGSLSLDAARTYCPSSPEEWYTSCRREMDKI